MRNTDPYQTGRRREDIEQQVFDEKMQMVAELKRGEGMGKKELYICQRCRKSTWSTIQVERSLVMCFDCWEDWLRKIELMKQREREERVREERVRENLSRLWYVNKKEEKRNE